MAGSDPDDAEDEARLFARASDGDGSALGGLVERYLPRLRAFVRLNVRPDLRRRESSDDVVQSVCRELIEQKSCLQFESETGFRGWLFTVARNKIREKARFHGRQRRDLAREREVDTQGFALSQIYASACSPSRVAMSHEQIARFEKAFDCLAADYQEVIALARIAGLPHDIVAERMGRTVSAVRNLLGRAILKLGNLLERDLE